MNNVTMMNNKVTCKRLRPNPIFEDWLNIIYKDAKLRNSRLTDMLKEALESLTKYPLPLKTGADCIILKGFNRRLCEYLDKLLEQNNNYSLTKKCKTSNDDVTTTGLDNSASHSIPLILNADREVQTKERTDPQSNSQIGSNNVFDRLQSVDLTASLPPELPKSSSKPDTDIIQGLKITLSVSNKNTGKCKSNAKKGTKKYKPAHRSGSYAILVALLERNLENPDKPYMTKEELVEKAQKYSEESFVRPKPDTYYTAWSSMTMLVKKGLVKINKKKKAEYILTDEGKELAREILEDAKTIPTVNDIIFNDVPSTSSAIVEQNADVFAVDDEIPSTSSGDKNVIEMAPGTFDIILLIDKNETGGLKKKNDPTVAQFNKFKDLKHEYRSLKVGDFTWIAKHSVNQDKELVLPFIVERKRMDDLGASIKDGRFHEQKFRLRKCGIDNVIYLVENYGKNQHVGLPLQSLMQALANTRVQDGFKVHVTDSLTNSARFLAMMTKRLTIRYQKTHLRGCNDDPHDDMLMTFDYFNKSSAKTKPLTVTETFIKLLLQLKGMSVEKALAITKKYPTPRSLIQAYVKCDRKEGETLLAYLKYGDLNRNVGPATSKTIYQLFSSNGAE